MKLLLKLQNCTIAIDYETKSSEPNVQDLLDDIQSERVMIPKPLFDVKKDQIVDISGYPKDASLKQWMEFKLLITKRNKKRNQNPKQALRKRHKMSNKAKNQVMESQKENKVANQVKKMECVIIGHDSFTLDVTQPMKVCDVVKQIASKHNVSLKETQVMANMVNITEDCCCEQIKNEMQNMVHLEPCDFMDEDKNEECSMCHELLSETCIMCDSQNIMCKGTTLPCTHKFHIHCALRWLKTNPGCPHCGKMVENNLLQDEVCVCYQNQKWILPRENWWITMQQKLDKTKLWTFLIHTKGQESQFYSPANNSVKYVSTCGMKSHPQPLVVNLRYPSQKVISIHTLTTCSTIQDVKRRIPDADEMDILIEESKYLGEFDQLNITLDLELKTTKPDLTLDLFTTQSKLSLPVPHFDETYVKFPDKIYGVYRATHQVLSNEKQKGWYQHFHLSNGWKQNPLLPIPQTNKGYNILLSTLIVTSHILSKATHSSIVSRFMQHFQSFPPMVITLYVCMYKMESMLHQAEKAAFIQGMYWWLKQNMSEKCKENELFEHSRIVFAYLLQDAFTNSSGNIPSTPAIHLLEYNSGLAELTEYEVNDLLILHVYKASCFAMQNDSIIMEEKGESDGILPSLQIMTKQARQFRPLALYSSNQFRLAPNPCLTLNADGNVCVFAGWEECSSDIVLYSPLLGREQILDPSKLTQSIQNLQFDLQDNREPCEGLMVNLDISASMGQASGFDNDNEMDSDNIEEILIENKIGPMTFKEYNKLQKLIQNEFLMNVMQILLMSYNTRKMIIEEYFKLRKINKNKIHPQYVGMYIDQVFAKDREKKETLTKEVPSYFQCPISFEVMKDPVVAKDGFTYDRVSIEKWFEANDTSPMTREKIKRTVIPNHSLKSEIASFYNGTKDGIKTNLVIRIKLRNVTETYQLPYNACGLDLYFFLWQKCNRKPSELSLWYKLTDIGDGHQLGTILEPRTSLHLLQETKEEELTFLAQSKYHKRKPYLSRMETVKQLFHTFINRSQAYDYPIHIGLTTFGSTVKCVCPLTPLYENFRDTIDQVEEKGDTRLFQSIQDSIDQLLLWKDTKGSHANLRILCLSDGRDSMTNNQAVIEKVARNIIQNKIRLDVVQIGEDIDRHLRGISYVSGGFFFKPTNLQQALKINELETFLCVADREVISHSHVSIPSRSQLRDRYGQEHLDSCDDEHVPKRRKPVELMKPSQPIQSATETMLTAKNMMKAVQDVLRHPHPAIDVYPNVENVFFWKVIVEGPEGSPYAGGCWLLYAQFPQDYPQSPPEIRFDTPIKHANVNVYGKICHSIFTRNYNQHIPISKILATVYGLLLAPDVEDPVDTMLAMEHYKGDGLYETNIVQHVRKYATNKSRQMWQTELTI